MKVSFILEDGRLAGPHAYLAELIYHLQSSISCQVVLPFETTEETIRLFRSKNIPIIHTTLLRLSKGKSDFFRYLLFFGRDVVRLIAVLNRTGSNVVYCAGGSWQIKGVIAGLFSRNKIVWHLNDTSMPAAVRLVFSALVPFVHGVVFASERTRQYYPLSRNARNIVQAVIQSPVDIEKFNPFNNHSGDDALIRTLRNRTVIGTVANINPIKRIDKLIEVASSLKDLRNEICFVVVGPVYDSQKEYYRRLLIKMHDEGIDNVYFAGARENVRPLLSAMDVYLCTSDSESSPIAVWEALAMGKVVISTDVGDIRLFADGESITVLSEGTAGDFANALKRVLRTLSRSSNIDTRSRQIAVLNFESRICAAKHFEIFKRI